MDREIKIMEDLQAFSAACFREYLSQVIDGDERGGHVIARQAGGFSQEAAARGIY